MLARDYFKEDAWIDKPFIKVLVNKVQDLDSDIGAFLYPETKQIIFFWKKVIIDKVTLNEYNTDKVSMEEHIKRIRSVLKNLKSGLIPIYPIQKRVEGINLKTARQL